MTLWSCIFPWPAAESVKLASFLELCQCSCNLDTSKGGRAESLQFSGSECQSKGGRAESLQFSGSECQSKGGRAESLHFLEVSVKVKGAGQ